MWKWQTSGRCKLFNVYIFLKTILECIKNACDDGKSFRWIKSVKKSLWRKPYFMNSPRLISGCAIVYADGRNWEIQKIGFSNEKIIIIINNVILLKQTFFTISSSEQKKMFNSRKKSYRFGMTWGWVNNCNFCFWVNYPFKDWWKITVMNFGRNVKTGANICTGGRERERERERGRERERERGGERERERAVDKPSVKLSPKC